MMVQPTSLVDMSAIHYTIFPERDVRKKSYSGSCMRSAKFEEKTWTNLSDNN